MALSERQMLLLDTLMYTDLTDCHYNKPLGKILAEFQNEDGSVSMEKIEKIFGSRSRSLSGGLESDLPAVKHLFEEILKDDKLCSLKVTYPTQKDYGGIRAACFVEPSGDVTVAFRGTGGSSEQWNNNTHGYGDMSQKSQEAAAEYIRSLPYDHMDVTGHSNGGNQAMYVTIVCGDKIDRCVSYEGQGFSKEFVQGYDRQIARNKDKIKNINGSKDFVDILLIDIAGETVYVKSDSGHGSKSDLEDAHTGIPDRNKKHKEDMTDNERAEDAIFNHGSYGILTYADRNGSFDENGNFREEAYVEQEEVCKWLHNITVGLALVSDIPVIGTITNTLADIGGIILGIVMTSPFTIDDKTLVNLRVEIDNLSLLVENLVVDIVKLPFDVIKQNVKKITDFFNKVVDWYNKKSGRIERMVAEAGTVIRVDTGKLYRYCDRIAEINGQLDTIDRDMDRLYFRLNLFDGLKLLSADVTTEYSRKLKACGDYLNDVAQEFENVENNIIKSFG